MIHFRNRRMLALTLTLGALAVFALLHQRTENRLGHASFLSGATLLACLVFLVLIAVRKRLVMLPLWNVSTWVQIHIYTGIFALVVYLFHVPRIIANGYFEGGLSLLFLGVSSSGLYGLYVSRTAPRKLASVPGEYRFDQIAWDRKRLAQAAAEILQQLEQSLAAPVLATFYRDHLHRYFAAETPVNFILHPNSLRRKKLLAAMQELDRYFTDSARSAAGQLAALVRRRDELDFHYAMQLRLRLWVVVHSALSLVLLLWSLIHTFLVIGYL